MTQQLRFKLRKTRLKMMRQKGGISQKKTAQPTSKRKRALSHGGNLPPPAPSRGLPPEMPKFPPPNDKQRKKTRDDPTQSQSVQAALDFFEPQELGKNICLMHALNNGLGGKHFEPTDLENASLGAGKSRTQDFSIEDLRVLGGINNSGSDATIRQSALGQKGFHTCAFMPTEGATGTYKKLINECHKIPSLQCFVACWNNTTKSRTGAAVLSNGHFTALKKTESGYWDLDSMDAKGTQRHKENLSPCEHFGRKRTGCPAPTVAAIFQGLDSRDDINKKLNKIRQDAKQVQTLLRQQLSPPVASV